MKACKIRYGKKVGDAISKKAEQSIVNISRKASRVITILARVQGCLKRLHKIADTAVHSDQSVVNQDGTNVSNKQHIKGEKIFHHGEMCCWGCQTISHSFVCSCLVSTFNGLFLIENYCFDRKLSPGSQRMFKYVSIDKMSRKHAHPARHLDII